MSKRVAAAAALNVVPISNDKVSGYQLHIFDALDKPRTLDQIVALYSITNPAMILATKVALEALQRRKVVAVDKQGVYSRLVPQIDELMIPSFLLVRNRVPLTPEQQAIRDARLAAARSTNAAASGIGDVKRNLNIPASMSQQEYDALQAQLNPQASPVAKQEKQAERQAKRAEREAKKAERPKREGLTSVGDIAKTLGIVPREARAILRAAKEPKPAVGWAGDATWATRIEGIIRAGMAQGKSTRASRAFDRAAKAGDKAPRVSKRKGKLTVAKAKQATFAGRSRKEKKIDAERRKRDARAAERELAAEQRKADVAKATARAAAKAEAKRTSNKRLQRAAQASGALRPPQRAKRKK